MFYWCFPNRTAPEPLPDTPALTSCDNIRVSVADTSQKYDLLVLVFARLEDVEKHETERHRIPCRGRLVACNTGCRVEVSPLEHVDGYRHGET